MLLRLKEDYDGAEPAAASVTVRNLITLGRLVGDASHLDRARATLERYGPGLGRVARVMPLMLANVAFWHAASIEVVIVGARNADDTRALDAALARTYLPWAVTVPLDPARPAPPALPWLSSMVMRGGKATAYFCQGFACQEPVTDPEMLERQLKETATPRRIIV